MPRLGTRAQHRNVALRVEHDVGRTGRQYGLRRRRCPDGWYTAVHRDLSPRNTLLTVADEDTGLVACDHLCAGAPQPPSGLEPADQTVVTVDTPVTLRWSGNAGVAEVDIEYERGNWSHCGLFTGGSCIFTPTSVGYYLWDVGTGANAFTPIRAWAASSITSWSTRQASRATPSS